MFRAWNGDYFRLVGLTGEQIVPAAESTESKLVLSFLSLTVRLVNQITISVSASQYPGGQSRQIQSASRC